MKKTKKAKVSDQGGVMIKAEEVHNLMFISDPHIMRRQPKWRSDDVFKTSLKKFHFVLDACRERKAALLIAGDLCDVPRDWLLLEALMDLFTEYEEVPVFAVYGQHDCYFRGEQRSTILGQLIAAGRVKLLRPDIPFILKLDPAMSIYLYGVSWNDDLSKVMPPKVKRASDDSNQIKVLVAHAPISATTRRGQATIYPQYYCEKGGFNFDIICCGDIHEPFNWDLAGSKNRATMIFNTGPMMRTDRTEEMVKHKPSMFQWDLETGDFKILAIPCSKDVFVIDAEKGGFADDINDALDEVVGEIAADILNRPTEQRSKPGDIFTIYQDVVSKLLAEVKEEEDRKRVHAKITEIFKAYKVA